MFKSFDRKVLITLPNFFWRVGQTKKIEGMARTDFCDNGWGFQTTPNSHKVNNEWLALNDKEPS